MTPFSSLISPLTLGEGRALRKLYCVTKKETIGMWQISINKYSHHSRDNYE